MVNSLVLGYSPKPNLEKDNIISFSKNLAIGALMVSSIISNPVSSSSGYRPVSTNANTSLSLINKTKSFNIDLQTNSNLTNNIKFDNKANNRIGGVYLEYDERIENKIDGLTNNLHDLDKKMVSIEHTIENIENHTFYSYFSSFYQNRN